MSTVTGGGLDAAVQWQRPGRWRRLMKVKLFTSLCLLLLLVVLVISVLSQTAAAASGSVPRFEPDPYWPKPLPNNWIVGQVSGIFVDSHEHIWVTNRPRTLQDHDKYLALNQGDCCI